MALTFGLTNDNGWRSRIALVDAMQRRGLFLLAALAQFPALCHAQNSCSWINAATAGGVLGGTVSARVTQANTKLAGGRPANAISGAGPLSADPEGQKYAGNAIDDSDCTFARRSGAVSAELKIEVRTMSQPAKEYGHYSARCARSGTSLKAVGTEAEACSVAEKLGQITELVIGRVRDRAFVIRFSMTDSSVTHEVVREKALRVADQVAGNLF